MTDDTKTVSISSKLYAMISDRIKNSDNEFSSIDEYVEYVLNEILKPEDSNSYDSEQEKEVKKVLEDLGYT